LGDLLKGVAAVLIGRHVLGSEAAAALAGAAAVAGHNWSVVIGWRGGAGGATASAALTALSPLAGAIVVPIGIIVLYFSRYASLATITAGGGGLVALAALAWLAPEGHPWTHVIYGALTAAIVLWSLRPNLKRLADGTERRITLW
jgi:glycerol-3-phosphate acyltransferase PlsY